MKKTLVELLNNESGLIISAEMVLVLTICVLGIVVGLVQVQSAIVTEFMDLSLAFSSLNQSYSTPSFFGCRKFWGRTSFTAGSGFIDIFDGCIGGGGGGGWGGGYGGVGGGGYGGGYAEIGGMGYSGGYSTQGSSVTTSNIAPQSTPCETCTPGSVSTGPVPEANGSYQTIPTQPNGHSNPLPPPPVPTKD
jgi:hypothetical protein